MSKKIKATISKKELHVNVPSPTIEQNNKVGFSIYDFKIQAILLAIIGFIFYANTFSNEWAFDDMMVVTQNEYVQSGMAGIPNLLLGDSYESFAQQENVESSNLTNGRYRPLSLLTFALEQQLLGIENKDKADSTSAIANAQKTHETKLKSDMHFRHVVNVVLYILSVIVFLYFLRNWIFNNNVWVAFLAALLFIIHPIHTEVVANVKSRDEILSLLFILLTLIYSLKYLENLKITNKIAAIVFCFLALLSKEYAVMLIVILPISFYLFKNISINKSIKATTIYLVPLLLYILLRVYAVKTSQSVVETEVINNPYLFATLSEKYATIFSTLLIYIKLLVYPHPLSSDYSYNQITYTNFGNIMVWISIIIHIALLYLMFVMLKKRHFIAFALAFYFVFLALVGNVFFNIGAPLGERLIYHSSMGFVIIIAYFISVGIEKIKNKKLSLAIVCILLAIIIPAAAFKTITRNADWKTDTTLFLKDVNTCPNSTLLNTNAGIAYLGIAVNTTNDSIKKDCLPKAIAHFNKAISMDKKYVTPYLNRGIAYIQLADMDKALMDCDTVIKYFPVHPSLPYLSVTISKYFFDKGLKYGMDNQLPEAIACLKKATEAAPQHPDIWYNLGFAYIKAGQIQEAKNALQKTLQLKPDHQQAKNLLAQLP